MSNLRNLKNLRLHFIKKEIPAQYFIIRTLPPYSIHCRCPFRVSEISSSFFPNLKIALLTFLCTSVNQTLTYIVLPLFLRQETVRRHDKKALLSIWHTKNVLDLFSKYHIVIEYQISAKITFKGYKTWV